MSDPSPDPAQAGATCTGAALFLVCQIVSLLLFQNVGLSPGFDEFVCMLLKVKPWPVGAAGVAELF